MRPALFLSAIALTALVLTAAIIAQPPATQPAAGAKTGHKAAMDDCAKACHECQRLCDSCMHHCAMLAAQGQKEHLKTMQTCYDCAAFCEMTGRIVATMGPFSDIAAESCATACNRCGAECEKFHNDAQMKQCAEECRRCERVCRNMMAAHGLGKPAPTK